MGVIEFDEQARKELNVVVNFRNLFLLPTERFVEQETTDRLNDMIAQHTVDNNIESITQEDHDLRVFNMVAEIMRDEDSQDPGTDVMLADITAQNEVDVAKLIGERIQGSGLLGVIGMGAGINRFPFSHSRCALHGIVHWLFRYAVSKYLYRMHPEIRFPVHRLVEFNVDVPDGSTVPQAAITGYHTKLILRLQVEADFEVPDTTEGLFNDDEDEDS